jgi:hypothetical protein
MLHLCLRSSDRQGEMGSPCAYVLRLGISASVMAGDISTDGQAVGQHFSSAPDSLPGWYCGFP